MSDRPEITVHIDSFQNTFTKAAAGHVADMRQSLRALEDGSFLEKAEMPPPGTVIRMTWPGALDGDLAARHTSRCFRSVVADFTTFLDQVLGARRLLARGRKVPAGGFEDLSALLAFVQAALDEEVAAVASDTTLRSRDKINALVKAGALSKDLARLVGSYFNVRRILEHYRGIPLRATVIFFRTPKLFFEQREIVSLPAIGGLGESVIMRMVDEKRILPAGQKIVLSETEIDSVVFMLQLIAQEIVQRVSALFSQPKPHRA